MPPLGHLQLAGYRRMARDGAIASIVFGVINVLVGAAFLGDSNTVGGGAVLGLGALLLVQGIVCVRWDRPAALVLDGAMLFLLAAWNFGLVVFTLSERGNDYKPSPFAGAWIIQLAAGVLCLKAAGEFARLRRQHGALDFDTHEQCRQFLDDLDKRAADGQQLFEGTVAGFFGRSGCRILLTQDSALFARRYGFFQGMTFSTPVWTLSRASLRAAEEERSLLGRTILIRPTQPGELKLRLTVDERTLQALYAWAAQGADAQAIQRDRAIGGARSLARTALVWSILGLFCFGATALVGLILALVARARLRRLQAPASAAATAGIAVSLVVIALFVIATVRGVQRANDDVITHEDVENGIGVSQP